MRAVQTVYDRVLRNAWTTTNTVHIRNIIWHTSASETHVLALSVHNHKPLSCSRHN